MTERLRFKSKDQLEEHDIEAALKAKGPDGTYVGGILYRSETDPTDGSEKGFVYICNPYEENPTVVRIETDASPGEVEAIRREIIPMREAYEILVSMAVTYRLRQPLLLEGPTAIGKTYLAEKFTELLHGRGVRPLEFYCSGQTDVSELTAKWVPKVATEHERQRWIEILESPVAQEELAVIAGELAEKESLPSEQKLALVHTRLRELVRSYGIPDDTRWSFEYGAVPRAMGYRTSPDGSCGVGGSQGTGFILHIEEVGLAEPQIINCLLQMRGKRGRLADVISLWIRENLNIRRGPRFWLVFSTNPPEEYTARNDIDPALARGTVFKRVGELSQESLRIAADYIFSDRFGEKKGAAPEGCLLDVFRHPEICHEIARIVGVFHGELSSALRAGEKGRQQKIPVTLDDMARVSDYLWHFQVRDGKTGRLDLTETLRRAIGFYYIDRLADAELKEAMGRSLEQLFTGDTGKIRFREEVLTRKEVLDGLVREAYLSGDDIEREKTEEKELEKQELFQAMHDFEDELKSLLESSEIPFQIKSVLTAKAPEGGER